MAYSTRNRYFELYHRDKHEPSGVTGDEGDELTGWVNLETLDIVIWISHAFLPEELLKGYEVWFLNLILKNLEPRAMASTSSYW